jgi:hypothetical protein
MRKLRLEFDRLQVESFKTSESSYEQGTVVGQQETAYCTAACPATFNPAWTPCGLNTNYECTSH